jgi:hypothetical protein
MTDARLGGRVHYEPRARACQRSKATTLIHRTRFWPETEVLVLRGVSFGEGKADEMGSR